MVRSTRHIIAVSQQYYQIGQQVEAEFHLRKSSADHHALANCQEDSAEAEKAVSSGEGSPTRGCQNLHHTSTVGSDDTLHANTSEGTSPKPYTVGWDGSRDPSNPLTWSNTRRAMILAIVWVNVFTANWASSADAELGRVIARQLHVSQEAESLSPSLYTFGVAAGALLAGPVSNTVGRRFVFISSQAWSAIWLLATALAPNLPAQCVFRFLAGTGGSLILAIHGASVADLYNPVERTLAWPTIALSSFLGTAIAPIAGGWIAQGAEHGKLSWRWAEWITLVLSLCSLLLTVLAYPETFAPVILKWKAEHLQRLTANPNVTPKTEPRPTFKDRTREYFKQAVQLFTQEPIIIFLGAWLILVYTVVYGFLQGFSFIFGADGHVYKWDKGFTGSVFGAVSIGVVIWFCSAPFYWRLYHRKCHKLRQQEDSTQPDPCVREYIPGMDIPEPEHRLWMAVPVAPSLPICLLWLGWTNYPSISPWCGLGAVTLFGISWAGIYVTVYQYILDVYGIYAGSALGMLTFLRYMLSGIINLVSRPMYTQLGVHWTLTVLSILAILLMPAPFLFMWKGPKIREKSKIAGYYDN